MLETVCENLIWKKKKNPWSFIVVVKLAQERNNL